MYGWEIKNKKIRKREKERGMRFLLSMSIQGPLMPL